MEMLKLKTRNGVSYGIWFSRNVTSSKRKGVPELTGRGANRPTGRGDKAAPSSSNLVICRTTTPWPLLYCQNWIPLALQTTDDPTRKVPKQSERVLCRPMDKGICNGDHLPANQSLPETALHPMEPAASQETWISGMGAQRGDNRNLYLLHDWKNSSHHDKSKWNPLLNLIGWSSLWKATSRLIAWRRKVRAEGTTLQACWRLPIKESSSFRVQWRFCDQ